jgi:hypothetical protein
VIATPSWASTHVKTDWLGAGRASSEITFVSRTIKV